MADTVVPRPSHGLLPAASSVLRALILALARSPPPAGWWTPA